MRKLILGLAFFALTPLQAWSQYEGRFQDMLDTQLTAGR